MESQEDSCNSLPFIDDTTLTDDETNPQQYCLKIIENYQNKNRNIEITNRIPINTTQPLSPFAPLADDAEFSDNRLSDSSKEEGYENEKKLPPKEPGMKLVIKGWNSSISIQGLDHKSSITLKRRCEKMQKKGEKNEGRKHKSTEETKTMEKTRKGRWKMLTKSIMLAKSARFERRALDERYPKYVLLKNEEEEVRKTKENYPKMFVFNDKSSKPKRTGETKPEFSFKKSFKNKTEPMVPSEEIFAKAEEVASQQTRPNPKENIKIQKKPLTERNVKVKKEIVVQRRKSLACERQAGLPNRTETNISGRSIAHRQIYNEIQGIFEDTLKLIPQEIQQSEEHRPPRRVEYYSSIPPQFRQYSCTDPYCSQPPKYVPVYGPQNTAVYNGSNSEQNKKSNAEQNETDGEIDLENLPFGILSSFFPRVVIMNAVRRDEFGGEDETGFKTETTEVEQGEGERKTCDRLEVPEQDLTLKSKLIQEVVKPDTERTENVILDDVSLKELPSLEEDQKTKSQGSETTEYLEYSEFDPPENESVERHNLIPPPLHESKEKEDKSLPAVDKFKMEDVDENSGNLSLTKIGYKMYDNLTKLSLNREKELSKIPEVSGCGCNGNGTKKSPFNITLESSNSLVKVTVPENELNFQIINSEGGDIQIGVMSGKPTEEEIKKTIVRREELWHSDEGGRALVLRSEKKSRKMDESIKAFQTFKVSLAENKEVVFSIEMNEKQKREEKAKEKSTKEMKVGTDDFDLAGGDFVCALGGNYKNLSPRIGQLLKHLHEKLETDERERKFLDEKINQKLIDEKFQGGILPGVFLVKHVSPRTPLVKKPVEDPSFRKPKKETGSRDRAGQVREYYCEECLATMRIFEDENPSVKSMVDKFETIIQLESY